VPRAPARCHDYDRCVDSRVVVQLHRRRARPFEDDPAHVAGLNHHTGANEHIVGSHVVDRWGRGIQQAARHGLSPNLTTSFGKRYAESFDDSLLTYRRGERVVVNA
jgi:hypothetical protein